MTAAWCRVSLVPIISTVIEYKFGAMVHPVADRENLTLIKSQKDLQRLSIVKDCLFSVVRIHSMHPLEGGLRDERSIWLTQYGRGVLQFWSN